jgi:hypothetical protein
MTGAERGEPARINPLVLNYYVWLMGLLQGLRTRRYELCYQGPLLLVASFELSNHLFCKWFELMVHPLKVFSNALIVAQRSLDLP